MAQHDEGLLSDSFMDDNMFDTSVDMSDPFAKPKVEKKFIQRDMLDWKITDLLAKPDPSKPVSVKNVVKAAVKANEAADGIKNVETPTANKQHKKVFPPKGQGVFKSCDFIGASTPIKEKVSPGPLNLSVHQAPQETSHYQNVLHNVSALNKKYQKKVGFSEKLASPLVQTIKTPEQVFSESLGKDINALVSALINHTDESEQHLVQQYEVSMDEMQLSILDEYSTKVNNREQYSS